MEHIADIAISNIIRELCLSTAMRIESALTVQPRRNGERLSPRALYVENIESVCASERCDSEMGKFSRKLVSWSAPRDRAPE